MKTTLQLRQFAFHATAEFNHAEEDNRKAFTLTSVTLVVFVNSLFVFAFIF